MNALFTEIDHVAIAVNDLDAAIAWYAEVFGAEVTHREVVESDGVEEALVRVADSYIQLLTPTREDSPVAKYLAKRGEGLHPHCLSSRGLCRCSRGGEGNGSPRHRRRAASRFAQYHRGVRTSSRRVLHSD